jgi:hypothetical protein
MADIKDISQVIHSALAEIGVNGELTVNMDGEHIEEPLGRNGDAMAVKIDIAEQLTERAPMHLWDNQAI